MRDNFESMQVTVPNAGLGSVGQHLPLDMKNPGFITQGSKQSIATVAQYVDPQEWAQLAEGVNALIRKLHYCNNMCAMVPFVTTCAVCFCPLVYVGTQLRPRVNAGMEKLAVREQLHSRGIMLTWEPKTKFAEGGLTFKIPANTAPLQQQMNQ